MNDDDGLRCAGLCVMSRAHLRSLGFISPTAFLVRFQLESGACENVHVDDLGRIREIIHELNPASIQIHGACQEESERIRAALDGRAPATLQ